MTERSAPPRRRFLSRRGVATVTDLTVDEIKDLLLAAGKSRVAHVEVSSLLEVGSGAGLSGDLLCHLTSNRCSIHRIINEHLYVENMFAERVFRVKYPLGSVVTPHRQD
ncbi:MAG: hypothetical protein Ct9H300mP12_17830 [Acidimicrobiales bacterium]|nr:MAG: hypothetical protein Ct9H300mP12_17830 [Acidimicrobiales bacterium]